LREAEDILKWYDRHARALPWRVSPGARASGVRPDPYRVWLSEIMLQQTTVAAVKDYFVTFTNRWPSVADLARAKDADVMAAWAGLGYYARARNLLKCARVVVQDHAGVFPQTARALQELPGIGPYTAAAVAAIAFDQPATVLDGNVERVMARLHNDHSPLPGAKPHFYAYAEALTPPTRSGDYAQAVMDLGATICTPKRPVCGLCPWRRHCAAYAAGTVAELPQKTRKAPKPTRHGTAYVARRVDGALLLETRDPSGLLGGMLGWPGTEWGQNPDPAPPLDAAWTELDATVRHTFTHFHLVLTVCVAQVEPDATPQRGNFVSDATFSRTDLPTVMRKVYDLAQTRLAALGVNLT